MLFENDDYLNYLFNNNIRPNEDIDEKFLRGNMFDDEYKPYKNMTFIKPRIVTEKDKLLFDIMKYCFAINDYNLLLDLHPENMEILNKYKSSTMKLKNLTKEYETKYGPLCIDSSDYPSFKWIESPWPWDKGDGKYV